MKDIGVRLRKLRTAASLTQTERAQRRGVSPSAVGMYERGCRHPDSCIIVKLCEVFKVSADCLLGRSKHTYEAVDVIREMSERIRRDKGILLNGVPMSEQDREKLLDAIELAAEIMMSKRKAR